MNHRTASACTDYAHVLSALACACFALVSPVGALPEGGNVVAGAITLVPVGAQRLDVVQQTARGAIDWQSFGIGANEQVNFQQPSAQAVTLNRVVGGDVSGIFGRLTANGHVFLVNPNGVLFGRTARVDVAGLVVSTANLSNESFLAGRYVFDRAGSRSSTITNQGMITATDGGLVAFIAPGVENAGVINARLGRVVLASGERFTLDLYGDQLVNLVVSDATWGEIAGVGREELPAFVRQSGAIVADGGSVLLSAGAARDVVDGVVNLSGSIRARTLENRKGEIVLLGGKVEVGEGATLDVSAAGKEGSGGRIFVSSETDTQFTGVALANAGVLGGDGGFVEISGGGRLTFRGEASASALQGRPGTVLFDPPDLRIGVGQDVEPDTISRMLQGGTSVTQAATDNLFVNDRIDGRGGVVGAKLTLNAGQNVELNQDILTNGGDVEVNATAGKITMGAGPATSLSGGLGTAILTSGGKVTLNAGGDILVQHLANTGGVTVVSATGDVMLNQKLVVSGPVKVSGKNVRLSHSIFTTGETIELGRADGAVILNPAGDEQLTGVASDALTLLADPAKAKLTKGNGFLTRSDGLNPDPSETGVTVNLTTNQITVDSGGGDILFQGGVDIASSLFGHFSQVTDPPSGATLLPSDYVALSLAAGTGGISFSKGIAAQRLKDQPLNLADSIVAVNGFKVTDGTPSNSTNTVDLQIRSASKVTAGDTLYINSLTPADLTIVGPGAVVEIFHYLLGVQSADGALPPVFAEAVLPGASTSATGGVTLTVPLAPPLPPSAPPPSVPTEPVPPSTPTTSVAGIIGSVDATEKETASRDTDVTSDVVLVSGGRGVGQSADLGLNSAANGPAADVFSGGNQVVEADLRSGSALGDNPYLQRDVFGRDLREEEKKRKKSQ